MQLTFKAGIFPDSIQQDVDIQGFLALFDVNMPILPSKTLKPLSISRGRAHFKRLTAVMNKIVQGAIDLDTVISQSRKLPLLDPLLPFFKSQSLQPYHLFTIGRFIDELLILQHFEKKRTRTLKRHDNIHSIRNIIKRYTNKRYSTLRLSPKERALKDEIDFCAKLVHQQITTYEKHLYSETGLEMMYPFPRQISPADPRRKNIEKFSGVSVSEKDTLLQIDYHLPESIRSTATKQKTLQANFQRAMQKKMAAINQALYPYYTSFHKTYTQRRQRTFEYIILWVARNKNLTLPRIHDTFCCKFENARLPLRNQTRGWKHTPLDIELKYGASILYGANMTGKTTVLKTLFVHLTLIKAGLPVPAKSIELMFPNSIRFHLPSAGDPAKRTSAFTDELLFFSQPISEGDYILVDDMFHSTHPAAGDKLSQIFMAAFLAKRIFFLCTSHYTKALQMKGLQIYRMKDALEIPHEKPPSYTDLLQLTPYCVEKIDRDMLFKMAIDPQKPLRIALKFPLPDDIIQRIRSYLKE